MNPFFYILLIAAIVIFTAIAIFLIISLFELPRIKSTQFTMKNPPKPPKTEYEVYVELNLERIELQKKIKEIDFKLKEISKKTMLV